PGGIGVDALAYRGTVVSPGHGGVGPAFVHEHQPLWINAGHLLAEFSPFLLDFRLVLLRGAGNLLLAREPPVFPGARDGHGAAGATEPLAQFLECGIGLLSD